MFLEKERTLLKMHYDIFLREFIGMKITIDYH